MLFCYFLIELSLIGISQKMTMTDNTVGLSAGDLRYINAWRGFVGLDAIEGESNGEKQSVSKDGVSQELFLIDKDELGHAIQETLQPFAVLVNTQYSYYPPPMEEAEKFSDLKDVKEVVRCLEGFTDYIRDGSVWDFSAAKVGRAMSGLPSPVGDRAYKQFENALEQGHLSETMKEAVQENSSKFFECVGLMKPMGSLLISLAEKDVSISPEYVEAEYSSDGAGADPSGSDGDWSGLLRSLVNPPEFPYDPPKV